MIIINDVVTFKSACYIYKKEKSGIKPNTCRLLTEKEHRLFQQNNPPIIKIRQSKGKEFFGRKIKDVTFCIIPKTIPPIYLYVFSW